MNEPTHFTRRQFVQTAAMTVGASVMTCQISPTQDKKIGLYISLSSDAPEDTVRKVSELGFSFAEFYTEDFRPELAKRLKTAMDSLGISCTGLMMLGPGPTSWNFYDGPETIGLVPAVFRQQRADAMKRASDFCTLCDIPAIETHVGFIPENPYNPLYEETVKALQEVVSHCKTNGHMFLYHAGQETPTTMIRMIEDVGLDNQGVGLDSANLIMYDKGHPIFALDIYGDHLKTVNAKDGLYPMNTRELGREVQIGQGAVNFPQFFGKLKKMNFNGPILIERETSGEQWEKDVIDSKKFLEKLWS